MSFYLGIKNMFISVCVCVCDQTFKSMLTKFENRFFGAQNLSWTSSLLGKIALIQCIAKV